MLKVHRGEDMRDLLEQQGVHVAYGPASCTSAPKPLNAVPSQKHMFKDVIHNSFQNWYSESIMEGLKQGKTLDNITVDLPLATLKSRHAKRVVHALEKGS